MGFDLIFFPPFSVFLEIYGIAEAESCKSNFQKLKSRVDLDYNLVSLHTDHYNFIHLAQQDSCLTWSMVQAYNIGILCDPEQINEHSCFTKAFFPSKSLCHCWNGVILKIVGTTERVDSYLQYCCMKRFQFIFIFCTNFILWSLPEHSFHTWPDYSLFILRHQ